MVTKIVITYTIASILWAYGATVQRDSSLASRPLLWPINSQISAYILHTGWNPKVQRDLRLFERRKVRLKLRAAGQFRIKPKTNKSVSKRFKITATGKIMYKRANRHHLQRKKNRGAKARTRRPICIKSLRIARKIKSVLHNR